MSVGLRYYNPLFQYAVVRSHVRSGSLSLPTVDPATCELHGMGLSDGGLRAS